MDNVVFATVEILVRTHGGLLGGVDVTLKPSIDYSHYCWNHEGSHKPNVWENRVNNHSLDNLGANIWVPVWHIVVEWTLNVLGQELWLVLGYVSID